ncbi:uncharacterized protein [Triticum aestivum]|uniref:uncharacterized protein n=1 Tax=Triticum aestivum TaxID=4565 RepID=UPI001D02358F|nr:uncharacterized protein LOC123096243 [Triticum aestivum]
MRSTTPPGDRSDVDHLAPGCASSPSRIPALPSLSASSPAAPGVRLRGDESSASLETGTPRVDATDEVVTPTSASSRLSSRRAVIFSPAVRADHDLAMAELRALSSAHPSPGSVEASSATEEEEGTLPPTQSASATPEPSTPPCRASETLAATVSTTTSLRRSGRHLVNADGASASDEDSMRKAMRRTASQNLDFDGYSYMLAMAPYVVYPATVGG